MNDLQRQLIERLGLTAPAATGPAPTRPAASDLDPDAHLATPWMARLRAVRVAGAPSIPPSPSLPSARQLTDKAAKALKAAGQCRAAAELLGERDDFLKRRERLAWSQVKGRFGSLDLPDRAYRALKQGDADPEKVWAKLQRIPPTDLKALGADRLRELLS